MRTDLPLSLHLLNARELRGFLNRAIREEPRRELSLIKDEYRRRGVRLRNVDYFRTRRIYA
jgi:hypothetical protein